MKIASDIDGVIADIHSEIQRRVKIDLGISPRLDWREDGLNWWTLDNTLEKYGIDQKWIYRTLFRDEWFWALSPAYKDNISTLQKWENLGHEIHLVTGRSKNECGLVTMGWLKKHKVPFINVSFTPAMHKIEYLQEKEISLFFEDRFFEANKCAAFGIRTFVLRRPWNKDYENRITNPLLSYIDSLEEATSWIKENS